MIRDSILNKPMKRKVQNAHTGFDYKGQILKNTMSNQMYNNKMLAGFIEKLDSVVCSLVDSAKYIHAFNRISMDKNDKSRN